MKFITVSAALSLLVSGVAFGQTPPSSVAPLAAPAPGPSSTAAQTGPETLTAGGSSGGMRLSGWFVAPTIGTTIFGDRVNYTPGLRGGVYLNKQFAVGVTAQGLANADTTLDDGDLRNFGSYGGLLLQYVWRSDQLIHGTFESTVGDGRVCAGGAGDSEACSRFLVLEPAANVEINLAKHVRLTTGVGYRFAVAGSGDGPSGRDLSGMLIRSSLVFGSF